MSSPNKSSEIANRVARGMDVTARGIDLLSTTAQLLNSPNGAIQAASNFIYWLGRERIGEEELSHCLVRARGLVHLNSAGMGFCAKVIEELELKHVHGPFGSIKSGCLGRTLIRDYELAWITSTITCLYQFHDDKFITYAMTVLIIRICEEKDGKMASCVNPWTDPTCLRMMPVISKISSSVWLNIVNTEYRNMPLPEEMRSVCPTGHHLDSEDLVQAIARLISPQRAARIMLQSRLIIFNLSLWLLYHFDGMFRVVVNNKVVYEKIQGAKDQEIEFRIENRCHGDGICENADQANELKMVDHIAGHWENFFERTSKSSSSCGSTPRSRRKLYQFNPVPHSHALDTQVKAVASDLTRWLCSLRVNFSKTTLIGIVYEVNLKRQIARENAETIMADLLKRSPSILQNSWSTEVSSDWTPESAQDIWSPEGFSEAAESSRRIPNLFEKTESTQKDRISLIWKCFPGLADLIEKAAGKCSCVSCVQDRDVAHLQPGCFKTYIYVTVLCLVGHSIADAFGADDLSGAEETSQMDSTLETYSIECILLDIAARSKISWQKWFEVASSVFLGRHYHNMGPRLHANGILPADNSMTLAIQYGDLSVVAPWVDISKKINHIGLFGFIPVHGRLCIATKNHGYQLLDTEFGIVQSRPTETMIEMGDDDACTTIPTLNLEVDISRIDCDTMLFQSDQERHILLNRVRAGRFSRIINPCAAVIMHLRQAHISGSSACEHSANEGPSQLSSSIQENASVYNLENILGTWNTGDLKRIHVSQVIDSYLKYHIALSLAHDGIVEVNKSNCWLCSANKLAAITGRQVRSSSGRFLINTRKVMSEGYGTSGDTSLVVW